MSAVEPPDLRAPPYLPHLESPHVLQMGLSPLGDRPWIETDSDLPRYHAHKLAERERCAADVYRSDPASLPAQREFADLLLAHLTGEQRDWFAIRDGALLFLPAGLAFTLAGDEPLWQAGLWVADDIVLMAPAGDDYRLVAATLCSPSHWRLAEKFGCSLAAIHGPIPGFDAALTPSVKRFLAHLRPEHPVVRYNWSLQGDDALHPDPDTRAPAGAQTPLFYRTERQSLRRLPASGAIAFTIRVYLHPLASLAQTPGALRALFDAIAATPAPLAHYKGFDRLAPALEKYRPHTPGRAD